MSLSRVLLVPVATAALALPGCWFQPFEPAGHACTTQDDCLDGYRCELSVCVLGEPLDAGLDAALDAGSVDDSGSVDDAGPSDTGPDSAS